MTDALKAALERLESAPLSQFWSEPICIQELRMKPGVHNRRLHQKGCWHKPFRRPRRFRFAHFPQETRQPPSRALLDASTPLPRSIHHDPMSTTAPQMTYEQQIYKLDFTPAFTSWWPFAMYGASIWFYHDGKYHGCASCQSFFTKRGARKWIAQAWERHLYDHSPRYAESYNHCPTHFP